MPVSTFARARRIERWSLVNAVGMLGAAGAAVQLGTLWPIIVCGIVLLAALVVLARRKWTPNGRFGSANVVTTMRVALLGLVPLAGQYGAEAVIGLSLLFLVADGLDGALARHNGEASNFGAFFDKETDALFLLILCALAAFENHLPLAILGVGLLRYVFVGLLFVFDLPKKTEERSSLARYVYGGMVTGLLLSFLPYPALYEPVVVLATVTLILSFGRSLWRIVTHQIPFPGS